MRHPVLLLALLLLVPTLQGADDTTNTAAVTQAIMHGDNLLARKQFREALDAYRHADKLSHHHCAVCLLRMEKIDRQIGDFFAALDDAKKAVKAAGDNQVFAALAHTVRGTLLAQMSAKPSDKKLREAEVEFRAALAADPTQVDTRYNLGVVLLRQEREADGIAELNAFIATTGADSRLIVKAREFIAAPVRAREPLSPAFSITTLDGSAISNRSLRGQVVLLDFWATWCLPCRESVPILADLRKKFSDRPFQIVGISSDHDEEAWKSFIVKQRMDWAEYLDASGQVLDAFDVHEYPTFIVLDRDGIIRQRMAGLDAYTSVELYGAIDKWLKKPAAPHAAEPSTPTAGPATPAAKDPAPPPSP
ncbi:MAG: thioredoxin-like domain-containing protein [Candidatus Acidiferrales bacterium]